MGASWCPFAIRNSLFNGGSFIGPVTIGLLHTVEGASFTPRDDSYYGHRNNPHFTIDLPDMKIYQHVPMYLASRALVNRSGGVETNREGVVQIEVVGFAGKPEWSRGETPEVRLVRKLMRWIERNTQIPRKCDVLFGGNEQYGLNNRYEMSNTKWVRYHGWCGHQHAPENSHWDPGKIDIDNLLEDEEVALTDAEIKKIVDGVTEAVLKYPVKLYAGDSSGQTFPLLRVLRQSFQKVDRMENVVAEIYGALHDHLDDAADPDPEIEG